MTTLAMSAVGLAGIVTAMIVAYLAAITIAIILSGDAVQRGIDGPTHPPMPDPVRRGAELARQTLVQAEELGAGE